MVQRARRTFSISYAGALAVLLCAACSSKTPAEASAKSGVQVTDGFRYRGGTAITAEHVVTDLDLTKGADMLKIVSADGKTRDANVLYRDADRGVAIMLVKGGGLEAAELGDSGSLKVGDPVTIFVYDKDGKGSARSGKFTGFRASSKRVYLETDLPLDEDIEGAGVLDRSGKLVGIMQFKLTPKLNYALPIEYVIGENDGIAHTIPGLRYTNSGSFVAQRDAAVQVDKPIEPPIDFAKLENLYSYSRTALVGKLVMLDDPSSEAHAKPVKFKMTATNASRAVRTIAEGELTPPLVQWAPYPADKVEAKRDELAKAFGDSYAKDAFSPYAYGELRYRIPLNLFCKNVTNEEVHNVNLTLADGRTTGDFGFADLINVCAAQEDGDGSVWERDWGMIDGKGAVPAASGDGMAKGKGKAKLAKGQKAKAKGKGKKAH